jgi:UDP-N-acetylmuramyl pentapeptide phosphotransferase/UDP-N-acetylglucosamine-1-phosphate transferase
VREYLLVLVVAAASTYLLTPYARLLAIRFGAVARVRDRDVHAEPTPYFGGLAMYFGLLIALLIARHLPALSTVFADSSELNAVAAAGGIICIVGLVVDKWELDALTKLAGEVIAAGVMVLMGVQLSYLPVPGGETIVLGQQLAVPLTVLLCVVLMNAVNFVDGLDGLAAGVVAIAGASAFLYSYLLSHNYQFTNIAPSTLMASALVGICIGFLPHNFSPARLFMGDAGAVGRAGRSDRRAVPRPRARSRTTDPRWSLAVLSRQAAPAPPPARDGALRRARGAVDVRAGGDHRVRRRRVQLQPWHRPGAQRDLAGGRDPGDLRQRPRAAPPQRGLGSRGGEHP